MFVIKHKNLNITQWGGWVTTATTIIFTDKKMTVAQSNS